MLPMRRLLQTVDSVIKLPSKITYFKHNLRWHLSFKEKAIPECIMMSSVKIFHASNIAQTKRNDLCLDNPCEKEVHFSILLKKSTYDKSSTL